LEVKRQNGHLFFNQEVASRGSIGHRTRWNLGASGRAGEGGTHARGTGEGIRADRADYHQVVGRTTGGVRIHDGEPGPMARCYDGAAAGGLRQWLLRVAGA
jgi:hypothetical protein